MTDIRKDVEYPLDETLQNVLEDVVEGRCPVLYALTENGHALLPTLNELYRWGRPGWKKAIFR